MAVDLGKWKKLLGERIHDGLVRRQLYAYDGMGLPGAVPEAVAYPSLASEVRDLVDLAAQARVPIVARGSGTGLSGGSVPLGPSVVVSFERMRKIDAREVPWRCVVVEPGAANAAIDEVLRDTDLFYAPDPASHIVSSIGGNIAENSGGPHALKYGITGLHVLGLQVVDARGRLGWLHAGIWQAGPDLVSLVVGSEGTLALVTAARLALTPRPEAVRTLLVSFERFGEATGFVSSIVASGLLPATVEFMDRKTIGAVEAWGVARYPEGSEAVLIVEFDGDEGEVTESARAVEVLARERGALDVVTAVTEEERAGLWLGRRGSYAAIGRFGKRMLTQDVTVPREKLTEMLERVHAIAGKYRLTVATVGHAGDGNLHPDFPYDPADKELSRRVHAANREVMEACAALGGSITGEHGIGTDKRDHLGIMYGPSELGLMAAVKTTLDPDGILNPGKAVMPAPRPLRDGFGAEQTEPRSGEELCQAVLAATASLRPLRVSLDAFTEIRVDEPNLTVEVGSGVRLADVDRALRGTGLAFPVRPLRERSVAAAVLTNDFGPESAFSGTLRQYLLAATYVTGAGELVTMGRHVMKNVAGYDLFRILIGSMGRLAVPVSFVFRLRPGRPETWSRRSVGELGDGAVLTDPGLSALFALVEGQGYVVYARGRAEGETAPGAEGVLGVALDDLRSGPSILDLAFPPERLPQVLSLLETPPPVVLPAAARILVGASVDQARALVEAASDGGKFPVRALFGPERTSLAPPERLRDGWTETLEDVFDPAGILGAWLFEGGILT